MAKIQSGRVKKTPPTNVSADRYNFIGLSETEPDLGVPAGDGYTLVSSISGVRSWANAFNNPVFTGTVTFPTGAITSTMILDGTIVNADINASAAIDPTKIAGTAVITTDSRLSNARTPTAHAATHGTAGSDPVTIAPSQVTGTAVITTDSRLSDQRTPSDNSVTSAKIVDGTILDADINASAAIAPTKISGTAAVLSSANAFTVGGHTITAESAAIIPLRINAAASQSENLLELRNSVNTLLASFNSVGTLVIPAAFGGNQNRAILSVTDAASTWTPGTFSVRSDAVGTPRFSFTAPSASTELLTLNGNTVGILTPSPGAFLHVTSNFASTIGAIVRGAASQTADLLQIQTNAGTVLGGRNALAQIYSGSTTTIKSVVGIISSIATGANPLVTLASAHNLGAGDLVTLSVTQSGTYDGTFVITNPSGTTFNITTALTTGQATSGGIVSIPAQASITARSAATIGLIVKGVASQTANLQEWQTNSTTPVKIASDGHAVFGLVDTAGQVSINPDGVNRIGLRMRLAASQSSDAIRVESSTPATLFSVSNAGAVTAAGATFTGAVSGTSLTLSGDLTVNGTTTTINSTTLTVDDKNIELGSIASPTNVTADGGGITLKGTTDKTFNWVNSTSAWTSSENIDLASGKTLKIAGTDVLSATSYTGNAATATTAVNLSGTQTQKFVYAAPNAANGTASFRALVASDIPTLNQDTTGNATTATNLAASTTTLASNVTASSLTSFGTDPTANTQAVNNSSTRIATTAFVLGQAADTAPVMDGTAAVGISNRYARQDHVHASDTSKANTDQTMYLGTTGVAINRASATGLSLAGVSIDGNAANVTGIVAATNGGTGQSTYAVGDLLVGGSSNTLTKLADIAAGNVLLSGGVGLAPSYGKVVLTNHVSGTLPVLNGGTGVTTSTGSGSTVLSDSPAFTTKITGGATFLAFNTTNALTLGKTTGYDGLTATNNILSGGSLTVDSGNSGSTVVDNYSVRNVAANSEGGSSQTVNIATGTVISSGFTPAQNTINIGTGAITSPAFTTVNINSLGGTTNLNGTVQLGTGTNLIFEGATNNNFDTTLIATDPTATRTIYLPNNNGTLALTTDLSSYAPLAGANFTGNIAINNGASTAITTTGSTASLFATANNLTVGKTTGYTDLSATNNILSGGTISAPSGIITTITDNYSVRNINATTNDIFQVINIGTGTLDYSGDDATAQQSVNINTGGGTYPFRYTNIGSDIGSSQLNVKGTSTFNGDMQVNGDLTVNGTTTTLNSTTLTVDDKNIELGSGNIINNQFGTIGSVSGSAPNFTATVTLDSGYTTFGMIPGMTLTRLNTFVGGAFGTSATVESVLNKTVFTVTSTSANSAGSLFFNVGGVSNLTADGGGITLRGTTDKTFKWVNSTSAWTSSEHISLAPGKNLLLNGTLGTAGQVLKVNSGGTALEWGTGGSSKYQADAPGSPSVGDIWVESDVDVPTDTYATLTSIQTLTNKTLTSPILNTPTLNSPTFSGTTTATSGTIAFGTNASAITSNGFTISATELGWLDGVGSNIQDQLNAKAATAGKLSQFAATTSAELAGVISSTTGTGALVFNTGPTFTTSLITASSSFDLFNTGATTLNVGGAATTLAIGSTSTVTKTLNLFNGATSFGYTKTVNIGTEGVSGSTTNVNIGSSVTGATTNIALNGVPTAPTAVRTTNTTQIATTEYVQANSSRLVAKRISAVAIAAPATPAQIVGFNAPADSIVAGDVFRFTGYATVNTAGTSASPVLRIKIGSAEVSVLTVASTSSITTFIFEAIVTCRSVASGTGTVGGVSSAVYSTGLLSGSVTTPVTINTAIANTVEATFVSGHSSRTYTFEHAILEKLVN